jgi:ribonucleases P/MRP protein subunit RPP40
MGTNTSQELSTQSQIPKILDYLVSVRLSWDFKNVINPEQFGFTKGRSAAVNLIYENFIIRNMESGRQVDSVYSVFSKAFDRVNHNILSNKLGALGVGDPLLGWLRSFLTGRQQVVKLGGSLSQVIEVSSGVPQGSHCGPVLFCLFLIDLKASIPNHSSILMFADDMKIFRSVESVEDATCLQEDLDGFSMWCDNNGMDLNVNKCFQITFSRLVSPIEVSYKFDNTELKTCTEMRDLGVMFDSKMTFSSHIDLITSRAMRVLGFVQRSSVDLSLSTFKLLYCSLVRSILEYSSVVWSPSYLNQIESLERVQNRFLRVAAYRSGYQLGQYSYDSMRRELGLQSLEDRRTELDLRFMHGLLNSSISCPELLGLVSLSVPIRRNRNSEVFYVPYHSTNYGQNEPITRISRTANRVHTSVDLFESSAESFRRQVRRLSP